MSLGRQIRAARGLLKWSAQALADKAGLTRDTINKIEDDAVQPREGTLNDIRRAFDENGVEFTDNSGVRLKPQGVEIFEGRQRFNEFYDFMYNHLTKFGGDVCCRIYDEFTTAKYRSDPEVHRKHMKELVEKGSVTFRVLAAKSNFSSQGYAQFRKISDELETPTGFYAFGDCLALMSFVREDSPYVVVLHSAELAEGYRQSFNQAWKIAETPSETMEGA